MPRPSRLRWLAPLLSFVLIGTAFGAHAAAQEDSGRLVLRRVDSASTPATTNVYVTWSGDQSDLDDVQVTDNAQEADADVSSLAEAGVTRDVVFVVDTSVSTDASATLSEAKEALGDYFAEIPEGVRYAVIGAGGSTGVLARIGSDADALTDAIDSLSPEGEGALLGGVTQAAAVDRTRADTFVDVVLITDGVQDPIVNGTAVRSALLDTGAVLHVVGVQDGGLDTASFQSLAADSGGTAQFTEDPSELGGMLEDLRPALENGALITYGNDEASGIHDLTLTVGSAAVSGSYVQGADLVGAARLGPRPPVADSGIAFLEGDLGKYLGLLAALLAVIGFVWAMLAIFVPDNEGLTAALRPYSDGYVAEDSDIDDGQQALAQTALLQRAVALTESFAEQRGLLTRVERMLEKAGLPLRAGEAMFFYAVTVVLTVVLVGALSRNVIATLLLGVLAAMIPPAVVNFMATRKKKAFEALLPDTLQLLSSTLRAGYSMMQGVEAVSQEAAEPMGAELRRVVTEARLGRPLEEALDAVALRMDSKDFDWAVMAIRIQREVGGNLSELLLTVAETMTQRERLRRDISSLTAEGRISAYVLVALPVGLGGFLYLVNREYIGRLFDNTVGQLMLGGAVLMIGIGMAWMSKIIKIEV
jgi:tight adherence protein B